MGRGSASGARSSPNSTRAGGCSGKRRSSMAPLPRRKRGPRHRSNQARERFKVHGIGRASGSSCGNHHCLGVAGGDHPPRRDVKEPGPAPSAPSTAPDRGHGVRQRQASGRALEAPHSAHQPLPQEPRESPLRRWSPAPPLSAALDRRTHDCLVGRISPTRGAL
jgi:hypothetical protein